MGEPTITYTEYYLQYYFTETEKFTVEQLMEYQTNMLRNLSLSSEFYFALVDVFDSIPYSMRKNNEKIYSPALCLFLLRGGYLLQGKQRALDDGQICVILKQYGFPQDLDILVKHWREYSFNFTNTDQWWSIKVLDTFLELGGVEQLRSLMTRLGPNPGIQTRRLPMNIEVYPYARGFGILDSPLETLVSLAAEQLLTASSSVENPHFGSYANDRLLLYKGGELVANVSRDYLDQLAKYKPLVVNSPDLKEGSSPRVYEFFYGTYTEPLDQELSEEGVKYYLSKGVAAKEVWEKTSDLIAIPFMTDNEFEALPANSLEHRDLEAENLTRSKMVLACKKYLALGDTERVTRLIKGHADLVKELLDYAVQHGLADGVRHLLMTQKPPGGFQLSEEAVLTAKARGYRTTLKMLTNWGVLIP